LAYGDRGESETGRRNTRNRRAIRLAYVGAILYQAGSGVGLFPEEGKLGLLHVFQELIILRRKPRLGEFG